MTEHQLEEPLAWARQMVTVNQLEHQLALPQTLAMKQLQLDQHHPHY